MREDAQAEPLRKPNEKTYLASYYLNLFLK